MRAVLDEVPLGARVAVLRLRSLGDCVLSTPAIALLKEARPDLRIGVVVDAQWADVYAGNPAVERILAPEVGALRAWRPTLALNLHGGTTSARLLALSGARWRAGFTHFHFQSLYNIRIPTAQRVLRVDRTVHTAEHAASAIFSLGVTLCEIGRARLYTGGGLPRTGRYAVIHPTASEVSKTWGTARFLALAAFFRNEPILEPVFVGGPHDDLSAFQDYTIAQGQTLEATKALIAGATVFAGNDSGPAHVAAAFGIPCLMFFGPSDPAIWGPWRTEAAVLRKLPIADITVEEAIGAACPLLGLGVRA